MIELFSIYKYAFLLCPLVSVVLCVFGTHLVSRNESLQLMALSQATLVGKIIGSLILEKNDLFSLLFSLIFFALVKVSFISFRVVREQVYIVVYLSFIALTYVAVTLFPALDSHFSVGFFGDIVSISSQRSIVLSFIFLILLVVYIVFHKTLLRSTINKSVLNSRRIKIYEEVFFITGILLSLYDLGFLFSLAFLIFPVLIAGHAFKNMRQGLLVMAIVSGLSSICGLVISIINSRVSTVPAQVLFLIVFLLIVQLLFSKFRRT